jgi:hypothetical protein
MTDLSKLPRFVRLDNDEIIERSRTEGDGPFDLEALPADRPGFFSRLAPGDHTFALVCESGAAWWVGIVRRNNRDQIELLDVENRDGVDQCVGKFGAGSKLIFARNTRTAWPE